MRRRQLSATQADLRPDRFAELDAWQLLDWRLLLPDVTPGLALVGEGAAADVPAALRMAGWTVAPLVDRASPPGDVVFLRNPSEPELRLAAGCSAGAGWLVVHLAARRRAGPAFLPRWRRRFDAVGAVQRREYWALPTLSESEMLVPLGVPGAVRLALARMTRSHVLRRGVKSLAALLLLPFGLATTLARDFVVVVTFGGGTS